MNNLIQHLQQIEQDYKIGVYTAIEYKHLINELENLIIKTNLDNYSKNK